LELRPTEGLPLTIVGILIVILLILLVVYLVRRVA
jgi:flagellar biogenesis protein FliO